MTTTHACLTRRSALLAGIGLAACGLPARGQPTSSWPSKTVRVIVPYPAGGVNDVIARQFGELLGKKLGQSFVVENRGGAGGTIGMAELARSAGDGHTFAFGAISPLTLNPHIMKLAYEPLRDIAPIASVMYSPVYVLATSAFKGRDMAAVLETAKRNPKGVSVATSGYGTLGHIMVEQLRRKSGANLVHIPYKGGSQLITDAAGGQFDLLLANPFAPVNALIAEGKLHVLAVTGPQRTPSFAQTPTLGELGFEAANLTSTFGFFAPGTTSVDIQQHMHQEVNRLLQSSDMQQRLRKLDNMPYPMSRSAFASLVRQDYVANAKVISEAGIQAQ